MDSEVFDSHMSFYDLLSGTVQYFFDTIGRVSTIYYQGLSSITVVNKVSQGLLRFDIKNRLTISKRPSKSEQQNSQPPKVSQEIQKNTCWPQQKYKSFLKEYTRIQMPFLINFSRSYLFCELSRFFFFIFVSAVDDDYPKVEN